MKNLVFFGLFVVILVSCDSKRVFEDYKTIDNEEWNKDSVALFKVNLEDTTQNYNLYINIRNSGKYPNSNIWLFVDIKSPDGELLTDTVEYILADNRGKWVGSGIGDLFDSQFLYKQNVYFPHGGEYTFSIKQGMRETNLQGIQDIGLRIEKGN